MEIGIIIKVKTKNWLFKKTNNLESHISVVNPEKKLKSKLLKKENYLCQNWMKLLYKFQLNKSLKRNRRNPQNAKNLKHTQIIPSNYLLKIQTAILPIKSLKMIRNKIGKNPKNQLNIKKIIKSRRKKFKSTRNHKISKINNNNKIKIK